jgi:D-alanyl-D-alanine carboxypeptidase/D-alanyl-D-alanine-endopeptidase (penicillin-binding protein 4)
MFEIKYRRIQLAIIIGISSPTVIGAEAANAAAELLDKTLTGTGDSLNQSVAFYSIGEGKNFFERDADKLVSPASVTKIITAAATLAKLGPDFKFQTRLFHTGARKKAQVNGDLIVVGDGDPFLVSEKIWQMCADLKHMGIKEFSGDLVIDNSLFDNETRDDSRADSAKKSNWAYDSPVSALGINFNTVALAVAPGDAAGQSARINIDPYPLDNLIIVNRLMTVNSGSRALKVSRETKAPGVDVVSVNGKITDSDNLQKVYRSVSDSARTSGEYIKAFLQQEGIRIKGKIRQGRLDPARAKFLMSVESYEMQKIISGLNKFSNNYIADVLVKRLGAAFPTGQSPNGPGTGSFSNGTAVLRKFLREDVGIKTDFELHNGSGLSTDNRVSARQIVQVLNYMEKRFDLFPEFLVSLPAAGWDGTLAKRFDKESDARVMGTIRAKTGTLTEPITVSSLAGYVKHPKLGWISFAVLDNGVAGKKQPSLAALRDRQDDALIALMKN